jgi:AcrR family transcriptional regulator
MEYSEKQLQIIDTAEQLFGDKGFDGTSVRDIAQKAGVNIAMISYYFGSKEKLLEAVFEKRVSFLHTQVTGLIANKELTAMQKIFLLIDDYIERIMQQPQFHKLMTREEMLTNENPIKTLICETKRRNMEAIKKLISEGQKNGEFRKNIDVVLLMTTLVGTIAHLTNSKQFYREMYHMEAVTEEEYVKYLRKKLSHHLKSLFKASLTYEA